ncbi:carboxypeptidase regulatory-like domain-containing protein [Solimonas sp. K1W22B-7]|uniref:carboxypeptidase-like regulatory domain-containing protein n=1 Tax=Solimonas sp. K1W22B-7 TaxID=2303331 RepID=UPI000E331700|nr:carboxypeptidase-like regulatory domain-containing protein [Solimonas sp. K1W22B-7]AXQ30794.1 carboxypeptidase regulatory-like domain-containing protein [Solimonas sp. K1W22B-7]
MQLQGTFAARAWRVAIAGTLALLAAACSDTDNGGPDGGEAAEVELSGTAAVGAPITGAVVTAKCGGGQTFTGNTTANGSYRIPAIPASALPCAVQVSGGFIGGVANTQAFHAFTTSGGTVNLTPLTDLAVALASGMNPGAWFNALSANNPPDLDNLTPALTTLLNKLRAAGYNIPSNLNPVTTSFTPGPTNPYDLLLEALADRLGATGSSYGELLVEVVEDGADFAPPPAEEEEEPTPGGTTPGTVNAALAGSLTLTYFQEASGAPFTDRQQVPVVIGANNTLQIDGKTLGNPYFRNFNGQPHRPEIIWFDAARKLEYALTDNELGHFNEINVGDTTGANAQGIPRFLGQLRRPAVTVIVPAALNGSYTPRIVNKSGSLNYTVGNNLPITIATDSINIDNGSFVFQPGDDGYRVFDNTHSTVEPNYRVTRNVGSTITLDLTLYVNGEQMVAFKLERTQQIGDGVFSTASLYAEKRPIPENVLAFFNAAVARSPATLTVVEDNAGYNSRYPAKCATMKLSMFKNGEGDGLSFTYFLQKGAQLDEYVDQQIYAASDTRYKEEGGNKIMTFSHNRVVLRADGKVEVVAFLGAADKDIATNDGDDIRDAGCTLP